MAACPDCGFELLALDTDGPAAGTPLAWHYDESAWVDAGRRIRRSAGEAAELLRRTAADVLRARPQPQVWSSLEYGCHVRDVLIVQRERVLMMLRGHEGATAPMGRDERVEHDGYNEQDPVDVAVQVEESARLLEGVLRRVGPDDWDRTIVYQFPQATRRSLRWLAVHTLHEVDHHLHDMRVQTGP